MMNTAKRITKYITLSLALVGLLSFALPASAVDDVAQPTSEADAASGHADEAAAAPAAGVDFKRSLPKVRQGTPIHGDKVKLSILAASFFFVSVFMAVMVLRSSSKKRSGAGSH